MKEIQNSTGELYLVIAEIGDSCMYGEGGQSFSGCPMRNVDITILVHDFQIYGLTKG